MFDIRRVLFYGLVIVLCASLIEAVVLSRRHGYGWRSAGNRYSIWQRGCCFPTCSLYRSPHRSSI